MSDQKKRGLGRGLSSLFGDAKSTEKIQEDNAISQKVLISDLNRNPYQPRINFDEESAAKKK